MQQLQPQQVSCNVLFEFLDAFVVSLGKIFFTQLWRIQLDIQPVALAKNFYRENNSFRFRRVIEPYFVYRFRTGVNNFNKIIRLITTTQFPIQTN